MPPRAGVTIELDRPRTLRYTLRAIEAIEKETGKNLIGGGGNPFAQMSATELVTVLHAGLLHEDHEVTRDVVLDNLDMADLAIVAEKVAAAFGATEGNGKAQGKSKAKG